MKSVLHQTDRKKKQNNFLLFINISSDTKINDTFGFYKLQIIRRKQH